MGAEALAAAQKHRAEYLDGVVKEAREELATAEKKIGGDREKAERCRELQQDLENAHREIKSYKAQLKSSAGDAKVPPKATKGVEKKLVDAQSEIADLKKALQGAGIELPKKAIAPS